MKAETLRLIPSTHVASLLDPASFGSPLGTYLACRRRAELEPNPDAPDKALKAGMRKRAGELIGRTFYRVPYAARRSGRLACVEGWPDGCSAEGQVQLILRQPKADSLPKWREALAVGTLPLAEMVEATVLSMLTDSIVQVAALFDGFMHVTEHVRDEKMEREVGAGIFNFWHAVQHGKVPAASKGDGAMLKKLYPRDTANHLSWKSLSAGQREDVEKWFLAREQRLEAEKLEEGYDARVMELIGEHSGIVIADAGVTHFIDRVDFKTKRAAPHAGTWKKIAEIHLAKLKPKSAAALVAKYMPEVGARSLTAYAGTGLKPIGNVEQLDKVTVELKALREMNPPAGSPAFKRLGLLSGAVEDFMAKKKAAEVRS